MQDPRAIWNPAGIAFAVVEAPPLDPVLDARYNVHQALKELVLLERHIRDPRQRCLDCICKHLLTLEALVEESLGLSHADELPEGWSELCVGCRCLRRAAVAGRLFEEDVADECAQRLREVRKALTPICTAWGF